MAYVLGFWGMYLYQFAMTKDNEYKVCNYLGLRNIAHFIDMNPQEKVFELPYINATKRCEEAERRVQYLLTQCEYFGIPQHYAKTVTELDEYTTSLARKRSMSKSMVFDNIEKDVCEMEQFVKQQQISIKTVTDDRNILYDYQQVLLKSQTMILGIREQPQRSSIGSDNELLHTGGYNSDQEPPQMSMSQIVPPQGQSGLIGYTSGSILVSEQSSFQRLIFRTTKGKVLVYFSNQSFQVITHQDSPIHNERVVYVLVFEKGSYLRDVCNRICSHFSGKVYQLPEDSQPQAYQNLINDVTQQLQQSDELIKLTGLQLRKYLSELHDQEQGDSISLIAFYSQFLKREKMIYCYLNKFKREGSLVYGVCWSHLNKPQLLEAFYGSEDDILSNHESPRHLRIQIEEIKFTELMPPTYFRTNEFTEVYQEIVDTYGVPSYKEINPAIFTTVTFPFLFGVMFGDMGHGILLFAFATGLLCFGHRVPQLQSLYKARYLLLLMGFFATYSGLIYNDFLSIPLDLFTSCYNFETGTKNSPNCVYPIGIDPIWYLSVQEIQFLNSIKMKTSVIIGVLHMTLGICVKGLNAYHRQNRIELLHEFLPQLIMLLCLFGYMDVMIIIKWCTNYFGQEHLAPSIITTMVGMFLEYGKVQGLQLFAGQQIVSIVLLVIVMLCIPWMLCVKPFLLWKQHEKEAKERKLRGDVELADVNQNPYQVFIDEVHLQSAFEEQDRHKATEDEVMRIMGQKRDSHKFDLVETTIHQLIETLEFVLGTISNTASYLRLWALSLAHSQLSKVFFELLLAEQIRNSSYLGMLVGFSIWCGVTLGIMMVMDLMECGLHTLRLHWVEFQNKFYKGQGYKYEPFSFDQALTQH